MNPALSTVKRCYVARKSGVRAVFITGTDTAVGKTVVTGCLARYLSEKGYNVITQKWIQTGCNTFSCSDIALHLKIMGLTAAAIKKELPYVLPYVFKHASSPHLAGKIENKKIDPDKIIKSFKALCGRFDFVIVEGVGGALVPFTDKRLVIDIVKELDLPVVIVTGNKLGAVNHTLLTIEALRARKIRILGLVFNNVRKEDRRILKDNPRVIGALSGQEIFGTLTCESSYKKLYKRFAPIGERISEEIKNQNSNIKINR